MNSDYEILAPAGSMEALVAAAQNGADAVYLGGTKYSARASANNFDDEELVKAIEYCHIRGVKVFVTVNILIKERELDDFLEYCGFLYKIGVDALILQDVGAAMLVRRAYRDMELHASTQLAAHSLWDVLYLQGIGFDRVVLARELDYREIEYICGKCRVDIEVFVHGALCVCYSGQCLMSSMLGTRSGNRGRCAQPCRQKYDLIDIRTGKSVSDSYGEYLLSPRDLNTVEEIGRLLKAGVKSLKLEGRMKRPEYVATVVSKYKRAVESIESFGVSNIDRRDIDELYTIFNRGFTKGYVMGQRGANIMNPQKPNNRGLYVGRVFEYYRKRKRLKLKLSTELKKGDAINLGGGTIGRIIKGKEIKDIGYAGEIIELDFVGDAYVNQEIYKTSDGELIERASRTYRDMPELKKVPVYGFMRVKLDEKPVLSLSDGNLTATVEGEDKVQPAMKKALDSEYLEAQLSKLGNTPFVMESVEISVDEGLFMPASEINALRRSAIEKLCTMRVSPQRDISDIRRRLLEEEQSESGELNGSLMACDSDKVDDSLKARYSDCTADSLEGAPFEIRNPESMTGDDLRKNGPSLAIRVLKSGQLDYIIEEGKGLGVLPERVYYRDIFTFKDARRRAEAAGIELILSLPRISVTADYERLMELIDRHIGDDCPLHSLHVSGYGQELAFTEKYEIKKLYRDWSFNTFNSRTIDELLNPRCIYTEGRGYRTDKICLSLEMTGEELKNVINHTFIYEESGFYKQNHEIYASSNTDSYRNKSVDHENNPGEDNKGNNDMSSSLEVCIYGYPEAMITEYCPMGVITKDCMKDKRDAECSRASYLLRDRENREFRLIQDIFCRTTILSNKAICLFEEMEELKSLNINDMRMDFTIEGREEIREILSAYLKGKNLKNSVSGHFYEGID